MTPVKTLANEMQGMFIVNTEKKAEPVTQLFSCSQVHKFAIQSSIISNYNK